MDHPLTSTPLPDPSLLDIENMTSDEWRTLITNRLVKQKDMFIATFKKKIIEDVNKCITATQPSTTIEHLQENLVKKINENQFELEYQVFSDGIVGATFEYVCQLIIKNSLENIKRTQNALNSFSLTPNTNECALQPCYNVGVQLQGLSCLTQIQCLSESFINTNDFKKEIQPINLNTQDGFDSFSTETKNCGNCMANKINTTLQNNKNVQKKSDTSTPKELNISKKVHIEGNYVHTQSSKTVEEIEDLENTQVLLTLADDISKQNTNFRFSDGFEDEKDTNPNNEVIVDRINKNQDKEMEDCKIVKQLSEIDKSLHILEKLVNNEYNKLDVEELIVTKTKDIKSKIQPSVVKTKVIDPKVSETEVIETIVTKPEVIKPEVIKPEVIKPEVIKPEGLEEGVRKQTSQGNGEKHSKKSSKTKSDKKSKKRKSLEEKEMGLNKNKNRHHFKKSSKSHKHKDFKGNYRKLKDQVDLIKTISSNSCKFTKDKITPDNSLVYNDSPISSSSYPCNSEPLNTKNAKVMNTMDSLECQLPLVFNNSKDNLSNNEFKKPKKNVKNTSSTDDEVHKSTVNNCKVSSIVTTKSVEKNTEYIKNKVLIPPSSSIKKSVNYKEIYEMDRKSLFSPDIILRSIPAKNLTSELSVPPKQHSNTLANNFKTSSSKSELNIQCSTNKKKENHQSCIERKVTNKKSKIHWDKEPKSNGASSSSKESSDSSVSVYSKFKRIKMDFKSKAKSKVINNEISTVKEEKTNISELESNYVNTLFNNTESKTENIKENNESNDNYIIQKQLEKYGLHNLKQLVVIIERDKIYL